MATKVRMNVTIDPALLKMIHALAGKNQRTLSGMVGVLLTDAVKRNGGNAAVCVELKAVE